MGKQKGPDLPATPTYKNDPIYQQGSQGLLDYGQQLSRGDFSGNLSWLSPTINNNNSALALAAAQGVLQPQFRDTLQQITNSAAANNQLNSSTFTDALARSQSDLNSQYQSIVSQQAINDSNQSNANRLSLFGTGLDTLQSATNFGLQNQGQENQFNLNNYSNQVAAILAGQKSSNIGGLTGALGMGIGALLAAPTGGMSMLAGAGLGGAIGGGLSGAYDSLNGGTGAGGYGMMGSGMGLLGGAMQSQQLGNLSSLLRSGASAPAAGAYASNFSNQFSPYNYRLNGSSLLQ